MAMGALQRSLDSPGEYTDDEIRKLHSIVQGYQSQPKAPEGETTQLGPDEEKQFKAWTKKNNVRDADNPESHYDYRGAFKEGLKPGADAHWPDTYKQHGHPTFSIESKYSAGSGDGGSWKDDRFIKQRPANLGEGGSMLGPTGMDMLAEKIPVAESPDDKVMQLMQDPNIKRGMKLSPKFDMAGDSDEYNKTHDVNDTQSASQRRDLTRPAEHIPPPPPNTVYGGMNPLDMFGASLEQARSNLPELVGGKVEHYLEPPVSQFRRDMAPMLLAQGIDPNSLGHESPQYKEYSDQRWAELYDQAKTEGRSIVRNAYSKPRTFGDKVEIGVTDAAGMGVAAAVGADEAAFGGRGRRMAADLMTPTPAKFKTTLGKSLGGGLDKWFPGSSPDQFATTAAETLGRSSEQSPEYKGQLQNYERLAESSPGARVAGQMLGAGSSIGMGGLASRGVGGFGALAGAARGAASATGTGTSLAFSEDRLPGAGELARDAALGAPFGMLGGIHGKRLRETTPLSNIEDAGMGETEMLRGVRRSPRAVEIQEKATAAMGPGREKDYLVGELEKPMTAGARDLAAMTKRDIGVPQQQYFNMSKDVRKPQTPLLKEAMKIHAGGSYETGGALPVHGGQNAELQKIIAQASHAEIIPAPSGQVTVKSANPASFDLSPEEAAQRGINVDRLMQSKMATGDAPGEYVVRVTPRELNPEQTENIIALLHEQIKEGKNAGMLDSLHRASREVRDQFPAMGPIDPNATATIELGAGEQLPLKGWSAWQHQAAEKTQRARRVVDTAGLGPGKTPENLGSNQADSLFGRTSAYKTPGRRSDADAALEELAGLGGASQGLKEVAGQAGLDEMKGGILGMARRPRSSIVQGLQTRLDPLLTFYGPGFGAVSPTVPKTLSGKQKLPDGLDPETYQRLRKAMGMDPYQF